MPELYISKVTLPTGGTYELKDAWAREQIETLSQYTKYLGVTTTALSDGSTINPITVNGQPVTAETGNIATYASAEFIYNGSIWQEFGDLSALGDFAYANTGTVSYTPAGSNAASAVSFTGTTSENVLKSDVEATVPGYAGTTKYLSTSRTTDVTVGGTGTASAVIGYENTSNDTFVKSYPGVIKKLATTSIPNVTNAGTAAQWSATMGTGADAETLIFSWTPNTPPTLGTAITAATGQVAASDASGADVLTGLGTAVTGGALTALGTPTTSSCLTGVEVTTQPVIGLASNSATSEGAVGYTESVIVNGNNNVTFVTSGHTASAITDLGTAEAAAQTFTGTAATITVNPVVE